MTEPRDDRVRAAWETNAEWWDAYYKEGNDFHLKLIAPATEGLLAIQPEERVLDIACGNGCFSRRLATLGATVLAFDFSEAFVECAKARTTEHGDWIDYRVLDATDREALLDLGEDTFDGRLFETGKWYHARAYQYDGVYLLGSGWGSRLRPSNAPSARTWPTTRGAIN